MMGTTTERSRKGPIGIGSRWYKAGRCTSGTCVEVRFFDGHAQIRDSKEADTSDDFAILTVTTTQFETFQDELLGEIPARTNGEIVVERLGDDGVAFRSLRTGVTLRYDAQEFRAFLDGVRAGEFRPTLASA